MTSSTSADSQPPIRPEVIIVGAGFGGLEAARTLKRAAVNVTIVDRHNHHLFQPLLYQVATAGLSAGEVAYPIRSILKRQRNARVILAEAVAVNLSDRRLILSDGELPYDFLILAAGARHSYFGKNEWEQFAPGLKTLNDALEIRKRILVAYEGAERESDPAIRRELLTFVIVGGGPTGVELAGAIAEIAHQVLRDDYRTIDPSDSRIVLIEGGPRLLPSFPEKLAQRAERDLRQRGVEVLTGVQVGAVAATGVTAGEQQIRAATTIWAAGVEAAPLARSLGAPLDRAGRILVEPGLNLPAHPNVFAIGDMASLPGPDGKPLPGVATVAIQQGRHAARSIADRLAARTPAAFVYHDHGSLATIGRSSAVAVLGGFELSGLLAWLIWVFVHIMELAGYRNRIAVLTDWAWAYFRFYRPARIIFGPSDAVLASWHQRRRRSGPPDDGPAS